MNHQKEFRSPFHLGDWIVRPGLNRIQGQGEEIQVEPRVMQVLLQLAGNSGQVCSRLGLLEEVWGDAVVGEENLTRAISELRRIFGDQARQPRYIETIRNHGYRLIVEAEPLEEKDSLNPEVPTEPASVPASGPAHPKQRGFSRPLALALGLTLVLVAVFGPRLARWGEESPARDDSNSFAEKARRAEAVPLTSFTGREWHPALSPDGLRTAFIWAGPEGKNVDVYLKQRNSETVLRLTDDPGWAAWPTWSPDGQTVAFVQQADSLSCLCSVSSLGGTIRALLEVESWIEGLDWSPDGASLVFSARGSGGGDHRLQRLELESLQVVTVPIDRPNGAGDFLPRISPDGTTLAWIGMGLTGSSGVFLAPARGGEARMLTEGMTGMQGLAWTADGSAIVFAEAHAGLFNLWRILLPEGAATRTGTTALPAEWLPTPGDFSWNPAIARQSGELVYEQVRIDQDIWRLKILARNPWRLESSPFLRSTRWESAAAFSPGGDRVVFVSSRSGSPEIWTCDDQGENLQRITQMGFPSVAHPGWSPDGLTIAANVVRDGLSAVMILAARGGSPHILTPPGVVEVFSGWSANGSLLVGSDQGQGWQIYELDPESGQRKARTSAGGLVALESRDGSDLYFTRPGLRGLWRSARAPDGVPELVVAELDHRDRHNWVLLEGRIVWVLRTSGSAFLVFQDIDTGVSSILAELPDLAESGLSISPDGNTIFYTRTRASEGDLILLKGSGGPS